jgi:hypothetical protein
MMQFEQNSSSEKKKVSAEKPEAKKMPEGYLKEKQRRKEIGARMKRVNELDQMLFRDIVSGDLSEKMERIESAETLTFGEEIKREVIGEAESGLNALTRRTYKGDPDRVAYVKPQSGETSFRYDPNTEKSYKVKRLISKSTAPETVEVEIDDPNMAESIRGMTENMPVWIAAAAKNYGITPEEVPLSPTEVSPRLSVGAGDFTMREVAVSRIDSLVNFNVVPMTVLRAEEGNTDLVSAQEAVRSKTDPEAIPREMNRELYEAIKAEGPNHPGAKSFMRIACMHYLVRKLDGHPGNIMYLESYDEETETTTGEFKDIDNGLALGLSRSGTKKMNGKEVAISEPIDAYWSVPMEMIQEWNQDPKNADKQWLLDDEAMEGLTQLYESTRSYLALREKGASEMEIEADTILPELVQQQQYELKRQTSGKEIKYLTGLLTELYGNRKIAEKEGLQMFARIGDLIQKRRPPELPIGEQIGNSLVPVRQMYGLEPNLGALPSQATAEEQEKATKPQGRRAA